MLYIEKLSDLLKFPVNVVGTSEDFYLVECKLFWCTNFIVLIHQIPFTFNILCEYLNISGFTDLLAFFFCFHNIAHLYEDFIKS